MLRLPLEIRNKIWTEVLGDRLVHIDYYAYDSDSDGISNFNKDRPCHESEWRHVVCQDDRPEGSPPQRITTKGDDSEFVYWKTTHDECDTAYSRDSFIDFNRQIYDPHNPDTIDCRFSSGHDTMRLTIMRSSRQIYVEANQVLWTTNTFSFTDPMAFKRFMSTRNVHQKRMLRNLRLEFEWSLPDSSKAWNSALIMPIVRSLSGLRNLRLFMSYDMGEALYTSVSNAYGWPVGSTLCEGLEKLSILPLQSVETAMISPKWSSTVGGWTEAQKKAAAGRIRNLLLNPNGAEVYAEAQRKQKELFREEREREAALKAQLRREHEEFLARKRSTEEKKMVVVV